MFKHLLLATDGSHASEVAIEKTMLLAKSIGAKVTGLHVSPEYHILTTKINMLATNKEVYVNDCKAHAERYLAVIEAAAKAQGVSCDTMYTINDHPYEAIITAATEKRCDMIALASHGRKGLQSLMIGSETQKVLAHSKLPVLVFR
jgi:nucleotide-binding universal stress UspA family protein